MVTGPNRYYAASARAGVGRSRLLVSAGLAVLAVGSSVAAMFLSYLTYTATTYGKTTYHQEWTPWGVTVSVGGDPSSLPTGEEGVVPFYGIALSLVGATLLVGAVLAAIACSARATRKRLVAARVGAVVYCTSSVVMMLMLSVSLFAYRNFAGKFAADDRDGLRYGFGVGYWVLLGMAALAVAAAVLIWIPARKTGSSSGTQDAAPWYQQNPYQQPQQHGPCSQYQQDAQYQPYRQPQQYQPYQQPQLYPPQ